MNWQHFTLMQSYVPLDLRNINNFLLAVVVVFAFVVLRYFLFVGPAYWFFWLNTKVEGNWYLHDQKLKKNQIRIEIYYSMLASLIFAVSGAALGLMWQRGWTQIYLSFSEIGLWYLPVSFVLLALLHEFYFYFTHRWMHQPGIYKRLHAVHHFSRKTSPWASFSFHPGEALVQALFLPVAVLILPLHPLVLIAYLTFMTLTAISNHLGVEILRPGRVRAWFISGEHHALHHEKFNVNFGLYFCFLDQVLGTQFGKEHTLQTEMEKVR